MELLLTKEKVWDTISKDAPNPVNDKWTQEDQTTRAIIGLNVENSQIPHIGNAKTAKEAWKALKEVHESDSFSNIINVIRNMYETKMQEGEDLQTHIEKMTSYYLKAGDLGETISEIQQIGILLSSLPKSWLGIVTALCSRKQADLKMMFVQSQLYDEYLSG